MNCHVCNNFSIFFFYGRIPFSHRKIFYCQGKIILFPVYRVQDSTPLSRTLIQQREHTMTKGFQLNEGQSVTTCCITMFPRPVSLTEAHIKPDEHLSILVAMRNNASSGGRRCFSIRKKIYAQAENKLFLILLSFFLSVRNTRLF